MKSKKKTFFGALLGGVKDRLNAFTEKNIKTK
jgi:hypothetical protein